MTPAIGDPVAFSLERSREIFDRFEAPVASRVNWRDINEPFGLLFPKLDYWLSVVSVVNKRHPRDLITSRFCGGLKLYLMRCLEEGYLGRFGATVAPHKYTLQFEHSSVRLLWIPKNSCTTLKRVFLSFEPNELTENIQKNRFHETCQRDFGERPKDFLKEIKAPLVSVLRQPYERIVSCYLDKIC